MMIWDSEIDGQRVISCYNSNGHLVATIFEDEEEWIFDLGIASPGELRISKTDLGEPSEWVGRYIGIDIFDEPPAEDQPFLTFIDDESKAVWQVWDVIDGGP